MSKTDFSKSMATTMYNKAMLLESSNPLEFFSYDENLELVLCLAYMTLSKEKIIKKDIKNDDKLGRLTKMVSTTDIDLVFDPSFNKDMPKVTKADMWDKLWILDNIRDSIMHGKFTVNMATKEIEIDNDMTNRKLRANVPFSWFISYTKNDIFKKKVMDKYTVSGFFYDIRKKDKKHFRIPNEIYDHIFYNATITGNKFNVNTIESRIKELFLQYKDIEISAEDKVKYTSSLTDGYKEDYLISFLAASDRVKSQIESEFPGLNVEINIVTNKHKLISKLSKKLEKNYKNYELLFDELEEFQTHRSTTLLNTLSNVIAGLEIVRDFDLSTMDYSVFNFLVEGKKSPYTKDVDIHTQYRKNLDLLKVLVLNAYAISTLVINQEDLYTNFFGSDSPSIYGIEVLQKEPLLKSLIAHRSAVKTYLDKLSALIDKKHQLSNIPKENTKGILTLTASKTALESDVETAKREISCILCDRNNKLRFNINQNTIPVLHEIDASICRLQGLHEEFLTITDKKLRKAKYDEIIEEFNKYISLQLSIKYWVCDNMKDALVVIRNSFSHIARMTFRGSRFYNNAMILNDYETNKTKKVVSKPNGEDDFRTWDKSGQIIVRYPDMVNMLIQPLKDEISLKKTN